MGRLEVRVCGARNIADTHKIGKPDPYVKINVGTAKETKLKYKTRVIEKSLNPVWNELFKFQIADADSCQLLFELWDECTFKDDLIGTYTVNLNSLKKGVVLDTWAILQGTKVSTTELHLRVLATDFGRAPEATDRVIQTLEADRLVGPTGQTARPSRPEAGVNVSPQFGGSPFPTMPQGVPAPVRYGVQPSPYGMGPAQPAYSPVPPPTGMYGYNNQPSYAPPQQGAFGYGGFGAPPPPPPRPPQAPVQYAFGVPPDM